MISAARCGSGSYPAELLPGSMVAKRYGQARVDERHRHRYEVNNAYRDQLEEAGLVISGTSPDSSAGGVHRAARRGPPLLRGHPGAPGAEVPADPAAPAVRRTGRGGPGPPAGHPAAGRRRSPVIVLAGDAARAIRRTSWPVESVTDVLAERCQRRAWSQDQVRTPDGELIDPRVPGRIPARSASSPSTSTIGSRWSGSTGTRSGTG